MNQSRHHVQVDIFEDGSMIVWTPAGPKWCPSGKDAGKLLQMIGKLPESFDIRDKPEAIHWQTENVDEFLARGGKITEVPPAEKETRRERTETLTLQDLGL